MTESGPQVGLLRIYVKDISFESPSAPQIFSENMQPEIRLNLSITPKRVSQEHYEVVLKMNLEAQHQDKSVFIIEVEQAGLFAVKGVPESDLEHLLQVFCPNVLFPYARQLVDQLLLGGGFPALMLAPVNFEQMLRAQKSN